MAEEGSSTLFNGRLPHILAFLVGLYCVVMLILQSFTLHQVYLIDETPASPILDDILNCTDPTDEYLRSKFGAMFMDQDGLQSRIIESGNETIPPISGRLYGKCCNITQDWVSPKTVRNGKDEKKLAGSKRMKQHFYNETCVSLDIAHCKCQLMRVHSSAVFVDNGICHVGSFEITHICHSLNA